MLRSALLAIAVAAAPLVNADWTECKVINNGPITKQTPEKPFSRKPDLAALTLERFPRTMMFDGMPPERFQQAMTLTVKTGSVDECGQAAPGYVFEACTDGHVVHMPNPCDFPSEKFAVLLCHEQAHVQGWPKDHGA